LLHAEGLGSHVRIIDNQIEFKMPPSWTVEDAKTFVTRLQERLNQNLECVRN